MAYGIKVFDEKGRDLITLLTPTFVLDFIVSPASGSRVYANLGGRKLSVYIIGYIPLSGVSTPTIAKATVSGNTVSWSGVNEEQPLYVVAE